MKLETKATKQRRQMQRAIARRSSLKQLVRSAAARAPKLPALTLTEAVEAIRKDKAKPK